MMAPQWLRELFPDLSEEEVLNIYWILGMNWGGLYGVENIEKGEPREELIQKAKEIYEEVRRLGTV